MMADSKHPTATRCGIALGLLGATLAVLKLAGVIAWSWWLVLAPFWAPAAVAVVLIVVTVLLARVAAALS